MRVRRRNEAHHDEDNAERWLLTYADMITLLLALFIILYSISNVNAQKFEAIAQQFRATMGAVGGTGSGTGTGTGTGTGGGMQTGDAGGITAIGQVVPANPLDQVYEALKDYVEQNNLQTQIDLTNTENYVRIHIKDRFMFVPDSPEMLEESKPVIEDIGKAIRAVYDKVDYITFSGHTADAGDHSLLSDRISWRLSTERALTVLTALLQYGLPQDKLSIQGFAYFQPVAPNDVEEGRARNRRVEITIYKYAEGTQRDQFEEDVLRERSSVSQAVSAKNG